MATPILTSGARRAAGGRVRELNIGVVDIGSNTVHLLAARTDGRNIIPLADLSDGLRLGGDVDATGTIGDLKLQQLLSTLMRFQAAAEAVGVTNLHLLATNAIRVADNREQVCQAITQTTGLPVEVLPPEQEAELAYMGADANCPSIGPQVMVDIGGGSMQIAVGQNGRVWDTVSLPLGAARVAAHFMPSDPPTHVEEALLVSYLSNVIPPALPLPDTNVTGLIGVGGTLRRMPALLGLQAGESIPADGLRDIPLMLRGRATSEIAEAYSLKPERARLLLSAALVLKEVARGYDFPPVIMSPYGLREGAILSFAREGQYPLKRAG